MGTSHSSPAKGAARKRHQGGTVKAKSSLKPETSKPSGVTGLPPELAEMIVPVDMGLAVTSEADVAAQLAAAHQALAACSEDVDVDVGDDEDGLRRGPRREAGRAGGTATRPRAKAKAQVGLGDDDEVDDVSLHSSDFHDEELLEGLREIEKDLQAESAMQISALEDEITALKKASLRLMKEGNKPAALEELKKARALEKHVADLKETQRASDGAAE